MLWQVHTQEGMQGLEPTPFTD